MAMKVLIHELSEPLFGATTAQIAINTGTGNSAIDKAADGEQLLAGKLEYMDGEEPPTPSASTSNGRVVLELKAEGGRRPGFRMPWSTCNAETNWRIHLWRTDNRTATQPYIPQAHSSSRGECS